MVASSSAPLTRDTISDGDSYSLAGRVFHAGDGCHTLVPQAPEVGCSATTWLIDSGAIRGVDVSDLRVVTISWRAGRASSATSRIVALVDERATSEQVDALGDAFGGQLGGPLSCFALLDGEWAGMGRVPIELTGDGRSCTLSVPDRLRMVIPGLGLPAAYSPARESPVPVDWALGWVGRGAAVSITMPDESWAFDAQDCQAFFAWFATRSRPATDQAPPGPSSWPEDRIWAAWATMESWWPYRPLFGRC
jgi:hypothetical protein